MRASLLLTLAMLAGCATPLPPKPEPVALGCNDVCYTPCDTSVPAWDPPDPNAPEAWDLIRPQVVDPLKAKADLCELHRRECQRCIDAAVKKGVITR